MVDYIRNRNNNTNEENFNEKNDMTKEVETKIIKKRQNIKSN